MSRLSFQPDLSKYESLAVASADVVNHNPPAPPVTPGINTMLVCPIPLLSSTPDGLRQYYKTGVPQYRLVPPGRISSPLLGS